ncbi:MAG: ABC transporter permease [Candidatus Hodarchaeota archaeon]
MSEKTNNMTLDETFVRKFAFREFEGSRRGRLWRIWSIATFNMIHQWNRSTWLKILFGFIVFIYVIQNMVLLALKDMFLNPSMGGTLTPNEFFVRQLRGIAGGMVQFTNTIMSEGGTTVSIGGTSVFILICVVLMGAGLIADDMQFKATEVYYAKLNRSEYILGKFGAFFLFGNLIFTLPVVLEWLLLGIGIGNVDMIAALPVLIEMIIFTEVITLVYGSIALAFSSLTSNRLYAGVSMFIVIFLISIIVPSLTFQATEFTPLIYLDIFSALFVFGKILAGEKTVEWLGAQGSVTLDLTSVEGLIVIPIIGFYILAGLAIVAFQVYKGQSQEIMRNILGRFSKLLLQTQRTFMRKQTLKEEGF